MVQMVRERMGLRDDVTRGAIVCEGMGLGDDGGTDAHLIPEAALIEQVTHPGGKRELSKG
jgi:hypothetical protein